MDYQSSVTFGVSCTGNVQALTMCLSSVLLQKTLPSRLQIRLEGHIPNLSNFYIEQLACLARLRGVEVHIEVGAMKGVRKTRDWHVHNCPTRLLWMGDDDCIYHPSCLERFLNYCACLESGSGFLQGTKGDVNNRRGYPDFNLELNPHTELRDGCSYNHFYEHGYKGVLPIVRSCDTGNVFFDVERIKKENIRFNLFGESYNCGGEDTLFAVQCYSYGLNGKYVPDAIAYHLEKEQVAFNEFAARKEMVKLACEKLEIDPEPFMAEIMPFVK